MAVPVEWASYRGVTIGSEKVVVAERGRNVGFLLHISLSIAANFATFFMRKMHQ